MVQAMINISPEANHILNIIKARHNLKDKSEAIVKIVLDYGKEIMEPELRPEFIEKIKKIERKGRFVGFNSVEKLKESIENA
jgi:hypothetical protein